MVCDSEWAYIDLEFLQGVSGGRGSHPVVGGIILRTDNVGVWICKVLKCSWGSREVKQTLKHNKNTLQIKNGRLTIFLASSEMF